MLRTSCFNGWKRRFGWSAKKIFSLVFFTFFFQDAVRNFMSITSATNKAKCEELVQTLGSLENAIESFFEFPEAEKQPFFVGGQEVILFFYSIVFFSIPFYSILFYFYSFIGTKRKQQQSSSRCGPCHGRSSL